MKKMQKSVDLFVSYSQFWTILQKLIDFHDNTLNSLKIYKDFCERSKLFKRKHFKGMIIMWLVRWYGLYALYCNDLREIAGEGRFKINRSTIYHWLHKYGKLLAKQIKPHLKITGNSWKLDEIYIKIKSVWHYLYKAIDKKVNTLDWLLNKSRNKKAAKKFYKKILSNKHIKVLKVIQIDKAIACAPAYAESQKSGDLNCNTKLR